MVAPCFFENEISVYPHNTLEKHIFRQRPRNEQKYGIATLRFLSFGL